MDFTDVHGKNGGLILGLTRFYHKINFQLQTLRYKADNQR